MKAFVCSMIVLGSMAASTLYAGSEPKRFQASISLLSYETKPRVEFNINGRMGLGLEGSFARAADAANNDNLAAGVEPESQMISSREFGVLVARYTNPMVLGGFYWAGGLGYRESDINWRRNVSDDVKTLNSFKADSNGQVRHSMKATGTAFHVRGGYRYVAESFPMTVGAYAGLRHFNSTVEDTGATEDSGAPISASSSGDKTGMKRQLMTGLELTLLDIGVAF